jgi:hypothetical protein
VSIDKETEQRGPRHGPSVPLFNVVARMSFDMFIMLVLVTPIIGLVAILWAIELGVMVRVFKEAYEWGYGLIF